MHQTTTAPMSQIQGSAVTTDGLAGAIAKLIAERVNQQIIKTKPTHPAAVGSSYMSIPEAAEYLRCKPQRIYDLVSSGRLGRHKDSGRVPIRRTEIEMYVTAAEQTRHGARRAGGVGEYEFPLQTHHRR